MPFAWSNAEWSDFIQATASLAWPMLIGLALLLFRKQLRGLIDRSEEIQTPVGTVRAKSLDPAAAEDVKRQLEVGARQRIADPVEDVSAKDEVEAPALSASGDTTQEILDLASRDVRIAFIRLLDSLEARVRDLAATIGLDPHVARWQDLLESLVEKGVLPKGVASNVTLLNQMRNKVVHGDAAY